MSNTISFIQPSVLLRTVRSFFDFRTTPACKKSRIIRKYNKSFEEFVFKGYDQQTPGLFRPGSFKDLRRIYKN
jgi:hypothetical protein